MLSGEPFLRRPETLEAISEISGSERVALYCGAGATRDQTGFGWDDLVRAVFDEVKSARDEHLKDNEQIERILRTDLTPQQKASIVVSCLKPNDVSESDFLRKHLKAILYRGSGWSEGKLLKNIADLAFQLASLDKEVVIITTNYDDFLIRRSLTRLQELRASSFGFAEALKDLQETSELERGAGEKEGTPKFERFDDFAIPVPGLRVSVLGSEGVFLDIPPVNNGLYVKIMFLHGIVAKRKFEYRGRRCNTGDPGEIVFSEYSYVQTQSRTTRYLASLINGGYAFLCVGASLTDPPLVEAFVQTAKSPKKTYALVTLPRNLLDSDDANGAALKAHQILGSRARHIGVSRVLTPSTFFQVAQFIEEISVFGQYNEIVELEDLDHRSLETVIYSARLATWWKEWSNSKASTVHKAHYKYLLVMQSEIEKKLEDWSCPLGKDEMLRLEMWVRINPTINGRHRCLTLFANSLGPIKNEANRREEPLSRTSSIASVRAFLAGKPMILPLEKLGLPSNASRWKSFLSVPISLPISVPLPDMGLSVSGDVPLGVITLSSTKSFRDIHSSSKSAGDYAAFLDPKMKKDEYRELVNLLEKTGRAIVEVASGRGVES
ncbi:MAG: hypothetical protein QM705_15250 [Ancrocorticia sp.]